jgi:mannan endo-1,4-beta-mannosidase
MALSRFLLALGRSGLLALAALSTSACGARYVDIIEPFVDPCTALSSDQCKLDTQHNCNLQPNPTGCTSTDPKCGAGICAGGEAFVSRVNEGLVLHQAPFTFVGTVSWGIAWDDNGCKINAYPNQTAALTPIFDELATMHVSVLRVWAFQSYAGATGVDFNNFDRLVARARAAGVRLLFVLENMKTNCTVSQPRDDAWFGGGYRSPYGNYPLSYRDYVKAVVSHFSNEPTILGWELMHQASGDSFAALDAFTDDMTRLIRSIDLNHLIALGLDDGASGATSTDGNPSNYQKLHDRDSVDMFDVGDYDDGADPLPAREVACQAVAHQLRKPIFVGEAGISVNNPAQSAALSIAMRADQMAKKIDAATAASFSGFLVYDYLPQWVGPFYDFDSRPGEPLSGPNGVIASHAPRYR